MAKLEKIGVIFLILAAPHLAVNDKEFWVSMAAFMVGELLFLFGENLLPVRGEDRP